MATSSFSRQHSSHPAASEWTNALHARAGRGPTPVPSAEDLFAQLDGREVLRGDSHYTIEVYGVSDWGGQRWIQAALQGTDGEMIAVQVAPATDADAIARKICALALHLDEPAVA